MDDLFTVSDDVRAMLPGVGVAWRAFETAGGTGPTSSRMAGPAGLTLDAVKDHVAARAYRDLSWRLGIDPTKRRPSGEALARRVLAGQALPVIHPLVDAYNRASAATLIPLSALDADRLSGGLALGMATAGERFHGIARGPEALSGRELVLRDGAGVVAVFLYRDSERTKVTDATRKAVVVACGAPGVGTDMLKGALERTTDEAAPAGWRPAGPAGST